MSISSLIERCFSNKNTCVHKRFEDFLFNFLLLISRTAGAVLNLTKKQIEDQKLDH